MSSEPSSVEKTEMSGTEIADYARARTVTIHVKLKNGGTSEGTGFYIDDQGTVVTCYHVIDGAREIQVEVENGGTFVMQSILDFDPNHDIAVLRIGMPSTPYFKTGRATVGENVRAVGSSLGTLTGTVSQGIVSKLDTVGQIDCVQTDAAISEGNSGGPLVNMYGEVVGINAYSYTGGQNLNLAVDISYLDRLTMNKNWSIDDYKEWYDTQTDLSYRVYNYNTGKLDYSLVNTYGEITGARCLNSFWDWDGEDYVTGFDKEYSIFQYEYDSAQLQEYRDYLKSVGFEYAGPDADNEAFTYYRNDFNNYVATICIPNDNAWVAIEITRAKNINIE